MGKLFSYFTKVCEQIGFYLFHIHTIHIRIMIFERLNCSFVTSFISIFPHINLVLFFGSSLLILRYRQLGWICQGGWNCIPSIQMPFSLFGVAFSLFGIAFSLLIMSRGSGRREISHCRHVPPPQNHQTFRAKIGVLIGKKILFKFKLRSSIISFPPVSIH